MMIKLHIIILCNYFIQIIQPIVQRGNDSMTKRPLRFMRPEAALQGSKDGQECQQSIVARITDHHPSGMVVGGRVSELARALQMKAFCGVLDADITGPDILKLLGIRGRLRGPDGIEPG
jgi:hypothetical protein